MVRVWCLRGGRVVPIPKKPTGVRPLTLGNVLRRIAPKGLIQLHKHEARAACGESQCGVACPAGADRPDKPEHSGKTFSLTLTFRQGIDQPTAKQLVKLIKEAKLKVQASIQGDQVRVTGKKRDDLQEAIAVVKGSKIETPLQFNNFRD